MTHLAHLLQRLLLPALLLCIACSACTAARAANGETITAVRRDAHILPNGQLAISTRFHTELPYRLTAKRPATRRAFGFRPELPLGKTAPDRLPL
uniref:Uncharacterized protein n=1 Tax=Conchiformibius kuhniae TaxID=211502 RepID=A0A8T9MX97_9NEIS|nr:hypothetical protein LVJ77_04975 [Conchiformibius kuhniae]